MRVVKIVLVMIVIVGIAFGSYKIFTLHKQVEELTSHLQEAQQTQIEAQIEEESVIIYLIESAPLDFHLVPVHRQTKGPISPKVALQELLKGPLTHEELFESVPLSVKILDLSVADGLATANFSREIVDDFGGGSLMESYMVEAIVRTLTEFTEIEHVQILVEGEIIESLGGHVLITGPLKRSP